MASGATPLVVSTSFSTTPSYLAFLKGLSGERERESERERERERERDLGRTVLANFCYLGGNVDLGASRA